LPELSSTERPGTGNYKRPIILRGISHTLKYHDYANTEVIKGLEAPETGNIGGSTVLYDIIDP